MVCPVLWLDTDEVAMEKAEIIGLLCDGYYGWYTPVTFADMAELPVHCWDNLLPLPEKDKGKDDND